MALPRLRQLVRAYVMDSLREQEEYQPERYIPNEMLLAEPSGTNQSVKKVYVHNKALTIFIEENEIADAAYDVIVNTDHCYENGFRFVYQDEADHASAHQSPADYQQGHTHILKNQKAPHQLLSPKNLKCVLNDLKEFEKYHGLCKDGKTECAITDIDIQKIETNFAEYIRVSKLKKPDINAAADAICAELESRLKFGAKTFTHIFLMTFLDKYIKPYLIDKFNDPQKANMAVDIIRTGITFALVESLFRAALSVTISTGLKVALTAYGMDREQVNIIVNRIASVLAFTENPLSLVDIGITDTAAEIGQKAAYAAIHSLPKLRIEPEIEEGPGHIGNIPNAPVVSGLRRRNATQLDNE